VPVVSASEKTAANAMAGVAVERILQKLKGIKPIASGWIARCPAHDDQHQSLQVSERPTDLSVGLHCHAGCSKSAIVSALGLSFADLFAPPAADAKQIVKTYDYRALDGQLLYQAVRFFPKEFRQRRPDGKGWSWNMTPLKGKHVAYRLPDLKGHNFAIIVEGEKDADRLWSLGIAATTNIGGAKKWTTSETKSLAAAGVSRVVILPDNDEPGLAHAELVASSVRAAQIAVSVLPLPDLPPHGDVSDWLNNGGSKEALLDLIHKKPHVLTTAQVVVPPAPDKPADALDVQQYHLTDLGAAESFRDRWADRLRYDHQREQWLVWDGHFWKPDADSEASRAAHDHVRALQRDALLLPDYLERKKYLDFALGREKRGACTAMMQHAQALKPIAIAGDAWDANGWLLGVPNGIVDLRTGQLRPGERDDFVTLRAGAEYGHAECPRWLTYLDEVFDGNAELIDYIHRAIGYSLTADMREQCFFVMYGSGSNGKSIFIDTLETITGSYGHRADMRMFAGFSSDTNAFQMADFRGKRMIFAAEVKKEARMNEHVLKHFTGGETLRAEYKYGRSFTIRPVGKIWLSVNHRPKVADDSYGFWRRVRLIPFLRTFAGSSDDRTLRDTLRAEAPGILAWAVAGTLEWLSRGLAVPPVVQAATDEYQAGEDPLADFWATRLVVSAATAESLVPFAKVYAAYREWASSMGISDREKMSGKAFGSALGLRFSKTLFNNTRCYQGFELSEN
jgi:putative DNA primase/helicase